MRPWHRALRSAPGREESQELPESTKFGPWKSKNAAVKGGEGIVSMHTKR